MNEQLNIQMVAVATLIPAEYNPRFMTEWDRMTITDSIRKFGPVIPIVVNSHPDRLNIIIGGHQRVMLYQEMGIKECAVVFISLPFELERKLNLRLNRNSGSWDTSKLADHFEPELLREWGFTAKELEDMFNLNPPPVATEKNIHRNAGNDLCFRLQFESMADYERWTLTVAGLKQKFPDKMISEILLQQLTNQN